MTSGYFISEGEICCLPRNPKAMSELKNVHADHLDNENNCLKLGECVLSINEIPKFVTKEANDVWDKMDVALIKIYEDVVPHLDLAIRDERKTKMRVYLGVPEENVKVKHYKYGMLNRGKVTYADSTHGIFLIQPSTRAQDPPECDRGALISKLSYRDGLTKVFGVLMACGCHRDRSYRPIALKIDTVIERVQREMDGKANGLRFY